MPRTTIERIVEARLRMLEHEVPGTIRDHDILSENGIKRGVITITGQEGQPLYVEFVETEDSIYRPSALREFIEATGWGGKALVIVPDEVQSAAAELLSKGGNPSIELVSYEVVGIYLMA